MKTRIIEALALLLLISSGLFFSCSDDDSRSFPAYPINLQAELDSAGTGDVTITWDKVRDAYSYNIYRATSPDGEYKKVYNAIGEKHTVKVSSTLANTTASDLEYNTTYYFKIVSVDLYGKEGDMPDEPFEVTTGGPSMTADNIFIHDYSNGTGETATIDYVKMTWKLVTNENVKEIEIKRNGSVIATLDTVADLNYEYKDYDVEYGTEYTYIIVVVTESGEKHESKELTITPEQPEEDEEEEYEIPTIEKIEQLEEGGQKVNKIRIHVSHPNDFGSNKFRFATQWEGEQDWVNYDKKMSELGQEDGNWYLTLQITENNMPGSSYTFRVKVQFMGAYGGSSDYSAVKEFTYTTTSK